jgi:cytochrome b pre-mRNA-processing protein 3
MPLFRRNPLRDAAELAFRRVVAQARRPGFFSELGVPDTVDGRFELIVLHAFLYLHRLKREHPETAALGQYFFDTMFTDFDRSLREMGTGDLSVGREIKRMAQAFYGRIDVYERGLEEGDLALEGALARNLFGTVSAAAPAALAAMRQYVRGASARLDAQPAPDVLSGEIDFGNPPNLCPVPANAGGET